ncbi:type I restriction-modification system endonuclease [Methylomonas sp. SURF-2]|uniref:Type I restriction-modification system endonuclease n=1 Tax=Methylomonas subterranea TaxID=2952225 RepID=A0ABT1TG20_9GAMM|nr:type I restriction-modification system endonuclease [Methylomonas sp. SURF-2]MCQ8104208.1 type I restriction-modification system endonuclease [Methylomonas sp. SURF-2]
MAEMSNFEFLKEHDPLFLQLASAAERVFASDPNTTLIKLRQLGEALAQDLAARCGIQFDDKTSQADLLFKLNREIRFDSKVADLFHTLRIEGNRATHQFKTQHKEALDGLRIARALAVWFHQSFSKQGSGFKPGPFIPPTDPSQELRELTIQIEQLKAQLQDANQQAESNQQLVDLIAREKEQYAVLAEQMDAEARIFEQMAQEQEQRLQQERQAFEARLQAMQSELENQTQASQQIEATIKQAGSVEPSLNEELTRILIDQQLIAAGWEADTEELTYQKGARPEKGKNKAIAEWPTQGKQSADYILFAGLIPIAVVEAKRENINVAGKISQAERYSRGFTPTVTMLPAWQLQGRTIAWPDHKDGHYQIPFVYSCNGRPFVKQLAEQSGTWFRDVREPSNLAKPLPDFHSPEGLLDKLQRSKTAAEEKLKQEGFAYLRLRDYQQNAVQAVELVLAANQTNCLLAMATGTGKTRTIIGLMYRFLKAERFKRILFLVDRTALGQQAIDSFNDAPLEQNQTLSKIYNVAELGDMAAEAETRIQVSTVQAMVKRIFQSDTPPCIDAYDCLIVDEAHRGYALDQDMTEGEMAMRDVAQYLSSYRRVLDYFDAVKIGLTATPAKHTTDIFGKPVYSYSYREAVADDWLIDHEPPIRYETLLTQKGIQFAKGSQVDVINTQTGAVELATLDDDMNFDVDDFNRRVISPSFNKIICKELVKELDPFGDEKTMIFCASDRHADMVKRILDRLYKKMYGDEYNEAAVKKITGQSDKVGQLIRQYKNERYPSIAITVDLLTTGIDVPKICHLVFFRRVRSRILYEQMLGRATRRCDEIGKTVFKIYDPVDIYAALKDVSDMKPLVKDPNVSIEQLIQELNNPDSLTVAGSKPDTSHAHDVLDALSQRIMRILRKAKTKAATKPALQQKLTELEGLWGVAPEKLHQHLHQLGPQKAMQFMQSNANLINQLEQVKKLLGSEYYPLIAEHEDELKVREQSYGKYDKPADYLESFNDFIKNQINQSAALAVVVNKPKDLTREQLREIRLLLDQNGYSEAKLQSAWRNQTNQDIAASIIGYIRRAAIGEALIPFEQRVTQAMQKIYGLHSWTQVQRKWLDRLAKQLSHEVVIDQQFVNRVFAKDGGAKTLNNVLDQQLDNVLDTLADSIWSAA